MIAAVSAGGAADRRGLMEPVIVALAKAAGLDKALADFPEDVKAAAEQALNNAHGVKVPTDPAAEPWPPMRAGAGL
jgi:hypothetical protein